jgi:hypothetical protein
MSLNEVEFSKSQIHHIVHNSIVDALGSRTPLRQLIAAELDIFDSQGSLNICNDKFCIFKVLLHYTAYHKRIPNGQKLFLSGGCLFLSGGEWFCSFIN